MRFSCNYFNSKNSGLFSKASDFIKHIKCLKKGTKVILICRVSGYVRDHDKHLDDQERFLRKVCRKYGLIVIFVYRRIVSGYDPGWLSPILWLATMENAALLAESVSRFIRHPLYNSVTNPTAQAEPRHLVGLKRSVGEIVLVTALHPDADFKQERAQQSTRGQHKKTGRPISKIAGYKKRRRLRLLPQALQLHRQGQSLAEIAQALSVPRATIHHWVQDYYLC